MSQPEVTPVAQRYYDMLPQGWREADGDEAGWLLLGLTEAALSPLDELWRLVEDPGPRGFFAVATVPAKWIPRTAERNGARLTGGMTEAEQRAEVDNPTGWRRTLPASIVEAATSFLPEDAVFLYRERTHPDLPGDQPAHMALTLHEDDVADGDEAAAILAAFTSRVPIGMFGHLLIVGTWWAEESAVHPTWADSAAAHPNWAHSAEGNH